MTAAAMDPERLAAIREALGRSASAGTGANVATSVTAAVAGELLADRDHQANQVKLLTELLDSRASESRQLDALWTQAAADRETKFAAVIAVMVRMDDQRAEDARRPGRFAEGGESRIRTALSLLRVALGLTSEWRDGGEG